ncbi:hemerythrin domain-containing protein [Tepidibacter aestuarii]|uniref:hemerythrin domain-containing protein n=1 Tax=Tepidibacter aestuarii TaxID=2925782 RepID=UPI0020C08EDA|nr:hemerythrin domain-containing protein [Tepidibacter aestuarii]CAH2214687.1 Hemerythrin-like domain-containing protein [Tepidibacter aestuarii]
MDAISLMMEEHKNIKRVLKVIRKLCIKILNKEEIELDVFNKIIDFVKNYADKHHHNKEEEVLFKKISEELGEKIKNGPIYGMLAEHDMGRLYILNLESALEKVRKGDEDSKVDIIANAISYTDLLNRHIDKEDNAIYKFGEKNLSKEAIIEVEEKCREIEKSAANRDIQNKYMKIIEELEEISKY